MANNYYNWRIFILEEMEKTNYKQKKINFGLPKVDHGYMMR